MHQFKPTKMVGALLLGTALAGLGACDQQAEPVARADDSATIGAAATVTASSPTVAASASPDENDVEAAPVASVPERRPAGPATARPSRKPTSGSTPAPTPANTDVAEPADPHAGHDMESMSGHDMDRM